ncbi:phosphocholine-specific phospholipase C [Actinomadura xylanilytica]|uniref:phosphocholine-specific phospholipase C n=1 Tax=Actinomadura xylanilytica TaxID=887459 RepID=UPI00255AB5E0|nr:phospholipase C, phosphocholine-specific [Actinomadura xylanilytica]MDL4772083.1 phospholipase C, phosphocholine-specific [Actinomadura xylanilytica]
MSTGPSRRSLLASGAAVAGGAAAASLLPPSVHAALARPLPPGGLGAIEHVVFLMQENRSFDHYFGTLRGVRGFADRNAVELPDGHPVFEQPGLLRHVKPFLARDAIGHGPLTDVNYISGLDHSWDGGQRARGNGWHNGWIAAKLMPTMVHYDHRDLPFQYELADTFTICDAYHSSVFGPTNPNRTYHWTGTIGSEPDGRRAIENDAYAEATHPGYALTSYAERLSAAGRTWRVYQEWDNFTDNSLEFLTTFKKIMRKALAPAGSYQSLTDFYGAVGKAGADERKRLLAALDQGVAALPAAERELFERALRRVEGGTLGAAFRADVAAGRLPEVSYIVASAAESEHPGSGSPIQGAGITYQVLDAIASHPSVWESTAVFLLFDENDGYFDHVPPPLPPADADGEHVDGKPIGLGFRVPMTVVSPWSAGGHVCSEVFDHTSTIRFLERWLGVREPNISPWRRTVAGDLTSAFDFQRAARPQTPARPGKPPQFHFRWPPLPPVAQKGPAPEPGTRPARPLPYRPEASARLEGGALTVTLDGRGARPSHFALYPYAKEFGTPRHFDVSGRRTERITPAGGHYRLTLTGANGFRREFAGATAGPAATAAVASAGTADARHLVITLANPGSRPLTFTLAALAYGTAARKVTVAPGRRATVQWRTRHGWYDVEIKTAEDTAFRRRLMGHLENGRASVSG